MKPVSTYRLQFNKDFTFGSARDILDYLHTLGISDIYASPIWKAKKGSMHGYDVVEPAEINPELGTPEDFKILKKLIRQHGFGWLQDIVPNHMAYSGDNQMLVDVLENGENSLYYKFFDVDWNHPHVSMHGRILAPFLGKFYQECLEGGEIKLKYNQPGFSVNYYENRLPVKMESYGRILSYGLNKIISLLGRENPDTIRYLGVVYFLRSLPSAEEIDERYYQISFVKEILWELYSSNETIKTSIDKTLETLNGIPGQPDSFNNLDIILREQHYRLSFWKVAVEEINYRRFFNINELISLRIEEEEVYRRTHSLVNKLVRDGFITGLRIDHVDGLYNPAPYLNRLKEQSPDIYLVVEKILDLEEDLPLKWPVDGTTGYEFINYLNGLFVNHSNARLFTSIYQRFTKINRMSKEIALEKKRLIIRARMAGEVERLAYLIESISSKDRYGIDITMLALKAALEEILVYFPVYRTYINRNDYSEQDRNYINHVLQKVLKDNPRFSNEIKYIGSILKMEFREHISEAQRESGLDFIMKFQQLTGPLMAKGFEDTALYIYNRFISLNEVGGDPGAFGILPDKFNQFLKKRQEHWPYSMNASSTHDTKRGEDVRARLNALSEFPEEWEENIKLWNKINKKFKKIVDGAKTPDRNDEYFIYQSIAGAFPFNENELPLFKERAKQYIIKAVREAKVHTAWIKPDEEYENTCTGFIEAILTPGSEFLSESRAFIKKITFYGVFNSLAQTAIKILSPGVPDIYQGSELWNLSFVDPDNRLPVDYNKRKELHNEIINLTDDIRDYEIKKMLKDPASGKIKLFLIYTLLKERNANKDLYEKGTYEPLSGEGELKDNIFGFIRRYNGKCAVVITGRFFSRLIPYNGEGGKDLLKETKIPFPKGNKFRSIITNEVFGSEEASDLSLLFKNLPLAVLVSSD